MIRFEVLSKQGERTYWTALISLMGYTGTNLMVISDTELEFGGIYTADIAGREQGITVITNVVEL